MGNFSQARTKRTDSQPTILKNFAYINSLQKQFREQEMHIQFLNEHWKVMDQRPGECADEYELSERRTIMKIEHDKLEQLNCQMENILQARF
jgi:hypothetical protein